MDGYEGVVCVRVCEDVWMGVRVYMHVLYKECASASFLPTKLTSQASPSTCHRHMHDLIHYLSHIPLDWFLSLTHTKHTFQ